MQKPFFSIVVVSLNPGERLKKTLDSIGNQTFTDYEVVLKDGGSTDDSLEKLKLDGYFENKNQIVIQQKRDKSIYDGMNQAVSLATGRYVLFLNCGDYFYSDRVLEEVAEFIHDDRKLKVSTAADNNLRSDLDCEKKNFAIEAVEVPKKIFYGNQYNRQQDTVVYSAPEINDFTCYRNVPCHQVCFYDYRLFEKRAYELNYKVRADYEHFLYSIYEEEAKGVSMPIIVASYEGGGFSESKENQKRDRLEHKMTVNKYMKKSQLFFAKSYMVITLMPLRRALSESRHFSKFYNGLKSLIEHLGSDAFPRIKLGVGAKPKEADLADWVTGKLSRANYELMVPCLEACLDASRLIMNGKCEEAMGKYNGMKPEAKA